jgi:hypothetical protein
MITGVMDNRVIILNRKLKLIVRRRPIGRTFSVQGYIVFDRNTLSKSYEITTKIQNPIVTEFKLEETIVVADPL